MAYDPEAREQSNSAMIIAVVALVIVVLGALAWFATRPADVPVAEAPTVIRTEKETVTEVPVPNDAPDTVIVQPNPAPETRTETQVTITPPANPPAATPPAASPAPAPAGDAAAPPADSGSGSSGY